MTELTKAADFLTNLEDWLCNMGTEIHAFEAFMVDLAAETNRRYGDTRPDTGAMREALEGVYNLATEALANPADTDTETLVRICDIYEALSTPTPEGEQGGECPECDGEGEAGSAMPGGPFECPKCHGTGRLNPSKPEPVGEGLRVQIVDTISMLRQIDGPVPSTSAWRIIKKACHDKKDKLYAALSHARQSAEPRYLTPEEWEARNGRKVDKDASIWVWSPAFEKWQADQWFMWEDDILDTYVVLAPTGYGAPPDDFMPGGGE